MLSNRGNGIIAMPQYTCTSSEDSFDSNPVDLRVIKRSHHNPQPGAKGGRGAARASRSQQEQFTSASDSRGLDYMAGSWEVR